MADIYRDMHQTVTHHMSRFLPSCPACSRHSWPSPTNESGIAAINQKCSVELIQFHTTFNLLSTTQPPWLSAHFSIFLTSRTPPLTVTFAFPPTALDSHLQHTHETQRRLCLEYLCRLVCLLARIRYRYHRLVGPPQPRCQSLLRNMIGSFAPWMSNSFNLTLSFQ